MSLSDPLGRLESIWNHSEPSEVLCRKQITGRDIFFQHDSTDHGR